jgi:type IV secretory pathway protease TraF
VVSTTWVVLAVSVLVVSFGAGWWVALAAMAAAWAASRFRTVPVSMVSAAAAIALGLYWLAIIPSTPGSELVVALLALESAAIASASWRQISELPRAPVSA